MNTHFQSNYHENCRGRHHQDVTYIHRQNDVRRLDGRNALQLWPAFAGLFPMTIV